MNIDIKVISLVSETTRRRKIKTSLDAMHFDFSFVDAIDGRVLLAKDYYPHSKNPHYFFNRRHIISPAEVGCKLSHGKAIKEFLDYSDKPWLLVLEDDVAFKCNFMKFIGEISNSTTESETIIHLGGQEGIRSHSRVIYIMNHRECGVLGVKSIFKPTLHWLYRTCGYILNRSAAQLVYNFHCNNSFVADDWKYLIKNIEIHEMGFYNCIEHPTDLSNSSIEAERK